MIGKIRMVRDARFTLPKPFNLQRCILTCLLPVFLFSACKFFPYNVRVSGRVLDTAGMAVAGAGVEFNSGAVETVTESDGTFQVKLSAGEHRLTISVQGNQIYDREVVIPASAQFNLGDLRPDHAFFLNRITVREQGQYHYRYDYEQWCAVTVADDKGRPIAGLSYDDFQITESMVRKSDGAIVAVELIPLKEQSSKAAWDLGLFERSVNSEKLDIIFLTDRTGSFDDDGTDVRGEVKRFVQKLSAEHIDFRIGGFLLMRHLTDRTTLTSSDRNKLISSRRKSIRFCTLKGTGGIPPAPTIRSFSLRISAFGPMPDG